MDRFVTRCRVPRHSAERWHDIEELVRSEFASECRREVLPRLPHQSQIIRIRKLAIQVRYTGEFDRQRIARAWAKAFAAELFAAMARSDSHGSNLVQSKSRTEWLARFIFDLVSGTAASQWEYEEFADALKLGTVDAVLTVLQREPKEIIIPVLQLLQSQRHLDKLLTLFGDLAYEQLFAIIAKTQIRKDLELTIADLFDVGELAKSESPAAGILATRRRALLIFLELAKSNQDAGTSYWSPRRVLYALIALDALINVTQSLPPEMWESQLTPQFLARTGRSLNPTILALLEQVRILAAEPDENVREQKLVPLLQLLQNLANDVAAKTDVQKQSYWVSGDCVGFLLLAGLIDRFRWPQHILESELGRQWGNRAVTCFLAGLAQRLLGKDPDSDDLDPGVAVFAGWLKPASADVHIVQTICTSTSDEGRAELIRALDISGGSERSTASTDWTSTFDYLGNQIVREFANRVRGFRKATPAFVVNTFLKRAGRICIDDKRILVILEPNPFHVALHISSMDEPLESVSWLDNRRLEFQLEGL